MRTQVFEKTKMCRGLKDDRKPCKAKGGSFRVQPREASSTSWARVRRARAVVSHTSRFSTSA